MDFLLDNDVVYKLAAFDLLSEALVALDTSGCSIYILNTLPFQAQGRRVRRRYGDHVIKKVIDFANDQQTLDREVTDQMLVEAMNERAGLDIGEMQLLSTLLENVDSNVLLTGDKNFMRSLSGTESLAEIVKTVRGKFISLEQIILCILRCFSFDDIKQKIAPGLEHDTCIRTCFGGIDFAEKGRTEENLLYHISQLQSETSGLLVCNDSIMSTTNDGDKTGVDIQDMEPSFF